ncbi:MAG: Uma2 family endonuclease [Chloroflexota bacterium]
MVAVPEVITKRRLTYEDYLALPEDQDYEIINGVLYVAPRPRPKHQRIAHRFAVMLTLELEHRGRGVIVPDADLIVSEHDDYVSPDVMFFAGDRYAAVDPDEPIRIIPDLMVEVLSPSTEHRDRTEKKRLCARLGVSHYWMADTNRRRLTECVLQPPGRYAERVIVVGEPFRPALAPDLTIDLGTLFE